MTRRVKIGAVDGATAGNAGDGKVEVARRGHAARGRGGRLDGAAGNLD